MNEQVKAIRNEIERLRKIEKENEEGYIDQFEFDFSAGYDSALGKLLSFLDSLPEESENHGCGVEFPHFGANYPDAKCIDGYLWDMDSYEDGIYTIGGDDPCPICNTEKWLKDVLDDEIFKTRDEALEYVKMLKSKYKHKDSLPEEPAPKGYDEAYLNECIAKASKTWEGVDVDKYMDEVRGYRPTNSDSLEDAAREYAIPLDLSNFEKGESLFNCYDIADAFIAGAEWQAKQGYTKETTVYANRWTDVDEVTVSLGRGEYGFKAMDKVIVQIRKA